MIFNSNKIAIDTCRRCEIANKRTNIVNGIGKKDANIMFIGEAPGYREDIAGTPFVGDSGELLNIMLNLIGIRKSDCFITNTIKCRPPNNRKPLMKEISNCTPSLITELVLINPKIIVLMGTTAVQTYFKNSNLKITSLHGKVITQTVRGKDRYIICIYHPSYILYNKTETTLRDYMAKFKNIGILYKYFVDPLIQIKI